jgi:quinol monooxygenase YgiN
MIARRKFIAGLGAVSVIGALPGCGHESGEPELYGLIGKIKVVPGERDALITILIDGLSDMPGCLSYIVARDPADADAVWVTEVWDSKASHEASLSLASVRDAITRGKPLIAGFGERFETQPVGGHGLPAGAVSRDPGAPE